MEGLYIAGSTSQWLTDNTEGFLLKYTFDGSSAPGPIEIHDLGVIDPDGILLVSWTTAIDPDGYIEGYELEWDTTPRFDWADRLSRIPSPYVTVRDLPDGTYYLRARARDNASLFGPWSPIQTINVSIVYPPLDPLLAPLILLGGLGLIVVIVVVLFVKHRIEE